MRATTAFNRIIAIDGVAVSGVTFTPEGVVVKIHRRKRSHQCPCGWTTRSHYDRSTRRWRHLDLGVTKCFLEAEICRIECAKCRRVRTEDVPWARPGARHTKDFCAVVAWLAQRVDKTTITKLLRVSWEAVAKIVIDVVGEVLSDDRFEGLARLGVDEVSYRKGHRYLTVVADHDREGRVVWAKAGKNGATLAASLTSSVRSGWRNSRPSAWTWASPTRRRSTRRPRTCVSASTPSTSSGPRQRGNQSGSPLGLERGAASRPEETPGSAEARRGPTPRPSPLDQAHPLGALKGPGELERRAAQRAARTATK